MLIASCLSAPALPGFGQDADQGCTGDGWAGKPDADFAAHYADTAFDGGLEDREKVAWMIFAR